jgi:hypothetical protein
LSVDLIDQIAVADMKAADGDRADAVQNTVFVEPRAGRQLQPDRPAYASSSLLERGRVVNGGLGGSCVRRAWSQRGAAQAGAMLATTVGGNRSPAAPSKTHT